MHWYWVDVVCTGFALILSKLIFKRFVSLRKNQGYSFLMFVEAHLNELVFVPISHLTLMSFCTQGLPGVAESTVSISHRIPFKVNKL